jgi:hypothetical protein
VLLVVADRMGCPLGEVLEMSAHEVLARAVYYRLEAARAQEDPGRPRA